MVRAVERRKVALLAVLVAVGAGDILFSLKVGIGSMDGGVLLASVLVAFLIVAPLFLRRGDSIARSGETLTTAVMVGSSEAHTHPLAMVEAMARIVHDIRGPVIALGHVAELMASHGPTVAMTRQQLAQLIRSEATNIEHTIDELMDLLSTQAGHPRIVCASVDPRALLESALATFRLRESHDLVVEYDSLPRSFHGDPGKITRAVTNLLANAFKYSPAGTVVHVRCFQSAVGTLTIEVGDCGPGVPPDERSRIFDPFVRGSCHDGNVAGSGIGLAVVRMVAQLHGGFVSVSGRPGGGALFTLTLENIAVCDNPTHRRTAAAV